MALGPPGRIRTGPGGGQQARRGSYEEAEERPDERRGTGVDDLLVDGDVTVRL
jgi:hypothetical protein